MLAKLPNWQALRLCFLRHQVMSVTSSLGVQQSAPGGWDIRQTSCQHLPSAWLWYSSELIVPPQQLASFVQTLLA